MEEAIKRLEWLRMVGNHVDSVTLGKEDMPYFDMAIADLREQDVTDINVGNKSGCGWCKQFAGVPLRGFTEHGCQSITVKFCPMCGRRLEEV